MDILAFLVTFGTVFLVEAPDTTFLATLVLATRYRPLLVWVGAALAFAAQTAIAVVLGSVVTLLPPTPVTILAGIIFLIGAIILIREARERQQNSKAGDEELAEVQEAIMAKAKPTTGVKAIATSFVVLLVAEFGDLSHLLIISMVARYQAPVEVYSGALVALLTVAALAVLFGKTLMRVGKVHWVFYSGAVVCLVLVFGAALELLGVMD